ncbi:M23 family metallopeptidase [Sphingomonas cannabina]|uniref:M23 family metallopeptidase n=1 Tax=Sphingomonas cannabina TaxID=2899123 RepID=UPI001F2108A8|nr:M23 family metallopeptidase [Sphingomonas cannabina]UIJ45933.1 M23 family metallopeptidase [Sphingomonas cannabina]
MYLRNDHGLEGAGGATALSFGRASPVTPLPSFLERLGEWFAHVELVPDLGADIGSRTWWRGAATCAALIAGTVALSPGFSRPLAVTAPPAMTGSDYDETRSLAITPLALGANSGRRLGATGLVKPLTDTPERPIIEATATLGSGEDFAAVLRRAGVGAPEANAVADMVAARMSLGELRPGTQFELTLGRRPDKDAPRPLEKLAFRAKFDLNIEVARNDGALQLAAMPIAIDHTPLRIQGRAGTSLYRSARAAGVPAKAVEAFIRSIASRMPISRVGADDQFDIIVEQAKAATGEVQLGKLLYAGLTGASKKLQLMRWEEDGKSQWFDPRGIGATTRGGAGMPVQGRLSSGFGMRRHPLLGYMRMHKGLDIAAPYGAPIRAAMAGVVQMAGRAGGYGNFVKLSHAGGMATGYGHMSRIAVRAGQRVSPGQVIGYVGSTGLSTGPHLHYELTKNGVPINPGKVTFESVQKLSGRDLAEFKSKFNKLMSVSSGGN